MSESRKIMNVIDGCLFCRVSGKSREFIICVKGETNTSGYTDPVLSPFIYIDPPKDGVWDYDFYATPPNGPVPQVITPTCVLQKLTELPADAKGVRIHSDSNTIEVFCCEQSGVYIESHEL